MHTTAVGRVAVVGHSLGGQVAMVLALRHPGLDSRLIVVDIATSVVRHHPQPDQTDDEDHHQPVPGQDSGDPRCPIHPVGVLVGGSHRLTGPCPTHDPRARAGHTPGRPLVVAGAEDLQQSGHPDDPEVRLLRLHRLVRRGSPEQLR
ncbi:alpha/beta fold hydrolase [Kocuria rhizosphaerae]